MAPGPEGVQGGNLEIQQKTLNVDGNLGSCMGSCWGVFGGFGKCLGSCWEVVGELWGFVGECFGEFCGVLVNFEKCW